MPRAVILDLFHTLVHGADAERDRVVADMGTLVGVDPAALVAAYHATWRDRLVRWDVEETVDILARRLGGTPSPDAVSRAGALRRDLARRVLDSVPPATLDALDALRAAGHRLALVSNATSETAEAWPHSRLAARLDVTVFSCELGVAKPDPTSYLTAADRLGVSARDCVFVGDGSDGELAGAAAVGMTVLRTIEHTDTDPAWAGPVIASLAELPTLLGPPPA